MGYSYSSYSDKGERPINEDCVDIIRTKLGVCLVLCDGLGGHDCGELASQCVCSSIRRGFEAAKKGCDTDLLVKKLIENAQTELLVQQKKINKKNAMRTTVCCVIISNDKCSSAYVGDSRIYHFRNSRVEARSIDHSVPQYLVNVGEIRECDIRHHPDRNKLVHVMGSQWDTPQYQVPKFSPMKTGDAFLLCSDGFWEWIEEKDMEKYLRKASTAEEWVQLMARHVLKNGKGHGMDNYSAVALFNGIPASSEDSFFEKIKNLFNGKDVQCL